MRDVTVLMATYRRAEILHRTLQAYTQMDPGGVRWKLVLIDNADDNDTQELATAFGEDFPIDLVVEKRRGKNHALNAGLGHAEGELFVFSDDDAMPEKDWLLQLFSGARRWPTTTMLTGKIVPVWPGGHSPVETRTDLLKSAYMVTSWGETEGYVSPMKVWGPNMAIRPGPFRDGYRFDTAIGPSAGQYAMGSELELVIRLSRAGHEAVYLPKAVVGHQIRPEQMEESWLRGRAYRSGRGVARLEGVPNAPLLLGIPRFVFREITTHGGEWISGWMKGDDRQRLDNKLGALHWLGKLREYWQMHRTRRHDHVG